MTDYRVARSYHGRIWVMPEGAEPLKGEWKQSKRREWYFKPFQKEAMEYGRASDAGKYLKGGGDNLMYYKAAMAVIGTMMSDTVKSQVATLINAYDGDPYYAGNDGGSKSGKSRLLDAIDLACKIAGADDAAEQGTEFHGLWELANQGRKPKLIQPHLKPKLEHYLRKTKPIRFIDAECLVVNDKLQRAGSMDHLMVIPKGAIGPDGEPLDEDWVVAGDGKTGRWDARYPAGVYAQLATYALGARYNQETNERSPIHPELRTDWGVLIHYPLAEEEPDVGFYWLNLQIGERAAMLNNSIERMVKYFDSVEGKPIPFSLVQKEEKPE